MLTKELHDYDRLPAEVKPAILALSVLIERIGSIPKRDRDDLFQLLADWRETDDPEEQRSIQRAMEEILAQVPISVRKMDLTEAPPDRRKDNWTRWVGSRIKELRETSGLTQVELAKKSGLDQAHISRIESSEYSPTNMTLRKIAKALGVGIGAIDPSDEEPMD